MNSPVKTLQFILKNVNTCEHVLYELGQKGGRKRKLMFKPCPNIRYFSHIQ